MKAVTLKGFNGLDSLEFGEVDRPVPRPGEVLLKVEAAGINFAELEMMEGRYAFGKVLPFVMGFEAAGTVVESGAQVKHLKVGDRITAIASSGGFAEFATVDAAMGIPIPDGISFAEATTLPVHGLTAYTLLKRVARIRPEDRVLVQAAAGGVGLYLVQLARSMGARQIIALAGSKEKVELARQMGADAAFNYLEDGWVDRVRRATHGRGVDVVLEAASGEIGAASFALTAPFGRIVLFGARNIHDAFGPDRLKQLIHNNQSVIGFNLPTMPMEGIAEDLPELLALIAQGKVKPFANHRFPLTEFRKALRALANRETIGKVVLVP